MTARSILTRAQAPLALGLLAPLAFGGTSPSSLAFEEVVRRSDRIVVATIEGVGAGSVRLPSGVELVLGIKDDVTGLVFTPYRVRISDCLLDGDASCRPGDGEVLVPGGTVYETVDGEQRLRTWELPGSAGAPLPPVGEDVLLFMTERSGRYMPLNDRGARIRVDRVPGTASVNLRFDSPRFLSVEGRESALTRAGVGDPATTRPVFIESVPLPRLKALIALAREVPSPTSGTRHAFPRLAGGDVADPVRESSLHLRAGEDAQRRGPLLGVGNDLGSAHRPDERGRTCGP